MSEADRIKELESEMLNNAKTARLIIDGLESRLAKAVGALRRISASTSEKIDSYYGTYSYFPSKEALIASEALASITLPTKERKRKASK